jgi:hypothetical protein
MHALRQLLFFVAAHVSSILLLNPYRTVDKFHRCELLSYSPSRGTYDIIIADRDNSLGYWDFVEHKMEDAVSL